MRRLPVRYLSYVSHTATSVGEEELIFVYPKLRRTTSTIMCIDGGFLEIAGKGTWCIFSSPWDTEKSWYSRI